MSSRVVLTVALIVFIICTQIVNGSKTLTQDQVRSVYYRFYACVSNIKGSSQRSQMCNDPKVVYTNGRIMEIRKLQIMARPTRNWYPTNSNGGRYYCGKKYGLEFEQNSLSIKAHRIDFFLTLSWPINRFTLLHSVKG